MKKLFAFFFATAACWGYTSLSMPAGSSSRITVPNVAPFSAQQDYRVEFRLHDWTLPSSGQVMLLGFGRVKVYLYATGNLCVYHYGDDQGDWGSGECTSLVGLSDVAVRTQRFGTTFPVHDPYPGSTWTEVMDLATGRRFRGACAGWASGCPLNSPVPMNVTGTSGTIGTSVQFSLAYLKWSSVTIPPGEPMGSEVTPADLADWRFEGSYTNSGTGGYAATVAPNGGSPVFAGSPMHSPMCNLSRQIFRAGTTAQLSHNSYPLDGSASLDFLWQELSGPTILAWKGRATDHPIVTGGVFGSYTFQLSVRDGSGQRSTCSVKDGFVATDANGVVVSGDPRVDILLGPQIRLGENPWSWFDDRHVAEAAMQMSNLATYYNLGGTPPWNMPGAGTIAVTNNSAVVTGTGTTFTTTFCQGPGNPTLPKSGGAYMEVWYPNASVPGGTGRRAVAVVSCTSDTSLILNRTWNNQGFLTAGAGWNYSYVGGDTLNTWISNVAPADFYDMVAAFYSLYYRSGIDDYLTTARLLADNFWVFRLDSGRNYFYGEGFNTYPRNMGILGMVLRALDGRPDMWSGLELIANYQATAFHAQFQAWGNWTQIGGPYDDPREDGYALMQVALCALFDPNLSAAAVCRAGVSESMTRGWTAARFADGNWYSLYNAYLQTSWETGTSISLTNGSPNGTCVNGTGVCAWSAAMFTNGSNPQVWWFTNSPGTKPARNSDGDPVVYYPVFVDASHLALRDINGNPANYQGTSGNHGWVVGTISIQVGYGVQPYMMGIAATALDFSARAMACTGAGVPTNCDNAIAANAHAYNVQIAEYLRTTGYWPATRGMYYSAGFVNCTPPVSETNVGCTGGNNTGQARVLNAEALRGVMTAYAFNGDPQLLSFGDTLYTAMWGKPGFSVGGGMTSDGKYISGYDDGYGYFMGGTPPAGQAHKYFGMGWGIGAGSAWPGYRLGGVHIGAMVSSSIAVVVSLVSRASSFNLLVGYPTGTTATIHCAASPCLAAFDQSQGNPSIQIQYLSASGTVLATQPYPSDISLN